MVVTIQIWNLIASGLWMLFLSRRLRYIADKQSQGILVAFFFAGLASVFVTFFIHAIYPLPVLVPFIRQNVLFYQVLVTGVVEEVAKFVCFAFVAHTMMTIKEPQDGVIQGAVVGLAFATVENMLYIEQYRTLFIAVRPILSSGGHMIYGAIWGGFYSVAVYSNIHSKDPTAYRVAAAGIAIAAVVHGVYNASLLGVGLGLGLLVRVVALWFSVCIFLRLVDYSPYRLFPLVQAKQAVELIRKGLHFNPTSAILNRNIGLYLMSLGRYRAAAGHLSRSIRRSYDKRRARFFAAVCELSHVPKPHALRQLRNTWSQLSDDQRDKLLRQLDQLLTNDEKLLTQVYSFIDSAFKPGNRKPAHELARELRLRKAERRRVSASSPVYDELVARLTADERRRLAAQVTPR